MILKYLVLKRFGFFFSYVTIVFCLMDTCAERVFEFHADANGKVS